MSEGEDKGPTEPPGPPAGEEPKSEAPPAEQVQEPQEEPEKKSDKTDKDEIADEEREKMIDDKRDEDTGRVKGGEVEKKKKALEEAALESAKRRVPIGGIKIPGFLRPKSREKAKEGVEGDVEEGTDLLEAGTPATEEAGAQPSGPAGRLAARLRLDKIKIANPFARFTKGRTGDGGEGGDGEGEDQPKKPNGAKLLNAVKLPLASVLPKLRPTSQSNKESEGVAPTEPTDDADYKIDENNMENVKLENSDPEKAALEEEAESKWAAKDWRFYSKRFYEFRYPIIGLVVLFVLLVIVIAIAISGSTAPLHAPLIDGKYISAITSCGPVQGILEDSVFVFRGIPWALPPVGVRRWMAPRPLQLEDCWNGTLITHVSRPSCLHISDNGGVEGEEDCLYLDVYTPHVRYDTPLPVVVVIGADSIGGGPPGRKLQPSPAIAHYKDVVFVVPSIRLGALGFLAATPLSQSTYPPTSGNYGLHDLKLALKWVQLNIEHFGGDKKAVTVLAHRAAATAVTALVSSIKPESLFARAWLTSGSGIFPNTTLLESERNNEGYLATLGCGEKFSVECLRKLDGKELVSKVPATWRSVLRGLPEEGESRRESLVQDGIIIRQHPSHVWEAGNVSVQIVIGASMHSEYTRVKVGDNNPTVDTEEEVIGRLKESAIAPHVDEALAEYGTASPHLLQSIIADIRTVCPLLNLHRAVTNSRFYLVTQGRGPQEMADGSMDVEALLGLWIGSNTAERRFVSAIQQLFYQFVSNGHLPTSKLTTVGQDALRADDFPRCALWARHGFEKYARAD